MSTDQHSTFMVLSGHVEGPDAQTDPSDGTVCASKQMADQSGMNSRASSASRTTLIGAPERTKIAKVVAENAIKTGRIFTIQGAYPSLRRALRCRGWVEQFYRVTSTRPKKSGKHCDLSEDEDSDDNNNNNIDVVADDHGEAVPPWEEDNGYYGLLSRLVRNVKPMFIWSIRRDVVDVKFLSKDQLVNHYGHASFTSKVGLASCLHNLPWVLNASSDTFFPRCYKLSNEEDKQSFIDDYTLTACVSLLKHVSADSGSLPSHKKSAQIVPSTAISAALEHCRFYLKFQNHEDIDEQANEGINDAVRDRLISWFYQVVHDNLPVENSRTFRAEIMDVLDGMREHCPQFEMDGTQNVWIVKPGAKSRGRGIHCFDRLDDMLKLVSAQVTKKDGKYVVQKYIERPLLVYQTKFDIRQWFLVTDWNPFTVWFYKESYLRFCSQEYTLEDFSESIHLSNNSIQKNYRNNVSRATELPEQNMWSCAQFREYLRKMGYGADVWATKIYPGMKDAVLAALYCSQDIVEHRKNSFELFGADFMLTEDLNPWLLEINASPAMDASTEITAVMCRDVLEDTLKVVLDRRQDKNADVGKFELAVKQPYITIPHYLGIDLHVEGTAIRKIRKITGDTTEIPQVASSENPSGMNSPCMQIQRIMLTKKKPVARSVSTTLFCRSLCGGRKRTCRKSRKAVRWLSSKRSSIANNSEKNDDDDEADGNDSAVETFRGSVKTFGSRKSSHAPSPINVPSHCVAKRTVSPQKVRSFIGPVSFRSGDADADNISDQPRERRTLSVLSTIRPPPAPPTSCEPFVSVAARKVASVQHTAPVKHRLGPIRKKIVNIVPTRVDLQTTVPYYAPPLYLRTRRLMKPNDRSLLLSFSKSSSESESAVLSSSQSLQLQYPQSVGSFHPWTALLPDDVSCASSTHVTTHRGVLYVNNPWRRQNSISNSLHSLKVVNPSLTVVTRKLKYHY